MSNIIFRNKYRILIILAAFLIICQNVVLAEGTSFNYTYNKWDHAIPTAAAYLAANAYTGNMLGVGPFEKPQDMFVTKSKELYILDSGNNRLVVFDSEFNHITTIFPKNPDGSELKFQEATGMFIDDKEQIFIADKKAKTVYIFDKDGVLKNQINSPKSDILPPKFDYAPIKVVVTSAGVINVISANTSTGALQFDSNLEFTGFYGSERVAVTPKLLADVFWKKILSKKQAAGMTRNVPTSYINFDIDDEDFVYTIRGGVGGGGRVRKLNMLGRNVLSSSTGNEAWFGDKESYFDFQKNIVIDSALTDIAIDDEGFITVLDNTRGRLFQYDQYSNLLFAFGGISNQLGNFASPVAIDTIGKNILVLDQKYKNITVFKPTDFGKNVRLAVSLYNDGRYNEALIPWTNVLKADANYELANIGIGKAYAKMGKYKEAMAYYKIGQDTTGYSGAFEEYRDANIRRYFPWIMIGVLALISLYIIMSTLRANKKRNEYNIEISKFKFPFYCMFHPFKGYTELKFERKGSVLISNIILILFFIVSIINRQVTGFHFNTNLVDQFNLFVAFIKTIGVFVIWVICNWSISTLTDGEGKFGEIWVFSSYALLPYINTLIFLTLISNILVLRESAFYSMASTIGSCWFITSTLMAVKEVHQFDMKKTIINIFITLLGIFLVALLVAVAYSMFTQLVSFIFMIYNELNLRK